MYNKEKMVYVDDEEENEEVKKTYITEDIMKQLEQINEKENEAYNIYGTVEYLMEDILEQINKNKLLYKYKYDSCKDYDKGIFQRIYTKMIKHYKFMSDLYNQKYNKRFEPKSIENRNYQKYNAEKCIMEQYDLMDDYLRLQANTANMENKDMLNEIIQDIQRNMTLLNIVYMGEE